MVKIYNTLTKNIEEIKTIEKKKMKIYTCGPTVYNFIHIGNARMVVFFDVLRRFYEYMGYEVNFVQNITDIDDRIIEQARLEGVEEAEISEKYLSEFNHDLETMNVLKPTVQPKVTEHLSDIVQFIQKLIDKGLAYETKDGVWYRVSAFKGYGKLTNHSVEKTFAKESLNGEEKVNPADFALWKKQKGSEIAWDSPFGKGRPGWHIECSAMSMKYLGETFDMHGGGLDLCFPHHVNEMAQTEGLTGKPMANYWVHNNFVTVEGQKMSKSLGNFTTLRDGLKEYSPNEMRWFFLTVNYENEMDYSEKAMGQARINFKKIINLREATNHIKYLNKNKIEKAGLIEEYNKNVLKGITNEMSENMSTSTALDLLLAYVKEMNKLVRNAKVTSEEAKKINITLDEVFEIFGFIKDPEKTYVIEEKEIKEWINKRENLKVQAKQAVKKEEKVALFKQSDAIRELLLEKGIVLEDTRDGTRYKII